MHYHYVRYIHGNIWGHELNEFMQYNYTTEQHTWLIEITRFANLPFYDYRTQTRNCGLLFTHGNLALGTTCCINDSKSVYFIFSSSAVRIIGLTVSLDEKGLDE